MKTVKLFLLLLAAAVLFSCNREAVPEFCGIKEETQTISLQVGLEGRDDATRTYVSYDGKVKWHANPESISVFTAPGVQSKFSKPQGQSNIFSGSVSSTPSAYVAVYPYSEANDMRLASSVPGYEGYDYVITSAIPDVQERYSGSFSLDTYPMAAASPESAFTMYGLAGGLRFTNKIDDIKFVVVRGNSGESLSGPLSAGLSLSDPVPGNITMDSSKGTGNVILCDPWRGEIFPIQYDCFVVLPPMTFTKGFTLYFVNSEGAVARVTTDKEIEIKRAHFSRITNLSEKMEAFVSPEPVDLGLSVKWSSCDIGTIDPLDPGVAVPWGLSLPRICSESDYPSLSFNKLPMPNDAAHALLGGNWRTPSWEEFKELSEKCTWTRISGGWKVTSKINGNSIEFPDAPHWTADRGYEFKDGSLSGWDAPYLRKSVRPVCSSGGIITFADANLEAVVVAAFDTDGDGHLSEMEAASVTYNDFVLASWGDVTRFTSFDEFKFFTGIVNEPSFSGWSGLKSIVLPASMKRTPSFKQCSSLVSVTLSEGVEEITSYSFSMCQSLESITIPSSVKRIMGEAFNWCNSLKSLYVPSLDEWLRVDIDTNGHPFSYSHNGSFYVAGKEITEVTFPSWCTSVPSYSFCGCANIASFKLHNGIRSIGNGAFKYCRYIEHINLPSGLEEIGDWAFAECLALKSIDIPEGVKSIGAKAFDGCQRLESLSLPASLETIKNSAFGHCSSLTKLYISDLKAWCSFDFGITGSGHPFEALSSKGGHLFLGTSEVTDLVIPSGVERIGEGCFSNCKFINSLTAPSGLKEIGAQAFSDCSGLVSVQLPSTLQTIGYSAFGSCSALTSITLPSSLQSLGGCSFLRCSSLETLIIPENVTSIGTLAFAYSGLASIDVRPVAPPQAGELLFDGLTTITVYVPAESVGAYKAASGWSPYSSYIQARP